MVVVEGAASLSQEGREAIATAIKKAACEEIVHLSMAPAGIVEIPLGAEGPIGWHLVIVEQV
jgi:hypothetical protein